MRLHCASSFALPSLKQSMHCKAAFRQLFKWQIIKVLMHPLLQTLRNATRLVVHTGVTTMKLDSVIRGPKDRASSIYQLLMIIELQNTRMYTSSSFQYWKQ